MTAMELTLLADADLLWQVLWLLPVCAANITVFTKLLGAAYNLSVAAQQSLIASPEFSEKIAMILIFFTSELRAATSNDGNKATVTRQYCDLLGQVIRHPQFHCTQAIRNRYETLIDIAKLALGGIFAIAAMPARVPAALQSGVSEWELGHMKFKRILPVIEQLASTFRSTSTTAVGRAQVLHKILQYTFMREPLLFAAFRRKASNKGVGDCAVALAKVLLDLAYEDDILLRTTRLLQTHTPAPSCITSYSYKLVFAKFRASHGGPAQTARDIWKDNVDASNEYKFRAHQELFNLFIRTLVRCMDPRDHEHFIRTAIGRWELPSTLHTIREIAQVAGRGRMVEILKGRGQQQPQHYSDREPAGQVPNCGAHDQNHSQLQR